MATFHDNQRPRPSAQSDNPPDGYFDGFEPDYDKTVRDRVESILRRKWLVLAVIAIGLCATVYLVSRRPPKYFSIATVTLLDPAERHIYGPDSRTESGYKYYKSYIFFRTNTLKEILNSIRVRGAVEDYVRERAAHGTDAAVGRTSPVEERIPEKLSLPIAIPPAFCVALKDRPEIVLSTMSTDPHLAAWSLEGYLNVVGEYYQEKKRADALKAKAWLHVELVEAEKNLSKSKASVLELAEQEGYLSGERGEGLPEDSTERWLQRLRSSLVGPTGTDAAESAFASGQDQPRDGRTIGALKQRLVALEARYGQLGQTYDADSVKMAALRKKMDFLRNTISEHEQDAASSAENLRHQEEARLKEEIEKAEDDLTRVRALGPQHRFLTMELQSDELLYDLLLSEYKKATQRAESESNDFTVTHAPTTDVVPPRYLRQITIGFGASTIAAILLALLLDGIDPSLRGARDIQRQFRCRILGSIPDLDQTHGWNPPGGAASRYEFLAHHDPRSPIYEAVRNVESSILLSDYGRPIRSIVISSSIPGEGKTLIAVSLAAVLSLDPTKRVLLLDADLRRPRIHKLFGQEHVGAGLATLVSEGNRDWRRMVHPSHLPRLFIMMSGPLPNDPVAILGSSRTRELLYELKGAFDYVVVDAPPLLGLPDALLLSDLTDGTVLVVQDGRIDRREFEESLRLTGSSRKPRLLGVVLNKVRSPGRWYGYKYSRAYYRGAYTPQYRRES
ncbi:MAG: polysaccharide biosynthesis tyrosine autokinase [Desulfomonile tiedjei]|nr:polysaccharide biosynthesis tyrosine autokinase [Desulfomonile tiedjei]